MSIDQLSARLRADHDATLLAVTRNGVSMANPRGRTSALVAGDDAIVLGREPR